MKDNQNIPGNASLPSDEEWQRHAHRWLKTLWRSIKHWFSVVLKYFTFLLALTVLWAVVEYVWGFCLWDYLPKKAALPAVLVSLLGKFFTSIFRPDKGASVFRPDGVKFGTHARQLLTQLFKKYVIRNTLLLLVLFSMFTLAVPAYAAKEQWVITAAQSVIQKLSTPRDGNDASSQPPPDKVDDSPEPAPPQDEKTPSDSSSKASDDADDDVENSDSQLINPETLLLNTEEPEDLTKEEYDKIFFMTGPHLIQDWDSEEQINEKVYEFVMAAYAVQSSPNYSMTGIPQPVQDSIAKASIMEGGAEDAVTLMEVICIRENAYGKSEDGAEEKNISYPIAKLLRENFGVFGDAYRLQNASDRAAFTLYGRSVIWGFKILNYDIPAEAYYKNLNLIAERYEKITMVVSANDPEFRYAGQLRDAFEEAAEQFIKMYN